ncbi:hypothetical protein QEH48_gp120 [Streptomyces phage TurkishDelight]|uniref:Uncharacterized protein n=1 Tax=Streptomyces phage TurkishDelight TaxID=2793708 RepID=A0A7T0Q3G8_9CAUD|nr:hypothetical protein QEH48_gp120 [Streptomyces phage TurkishDelight]QPL14149.1 hypothetical protein SEA_TURKISHDELIGHT_120 [Streptomyces phage TurkishDelight]
MGACLEPTPDMGPYRVEMRGQSFYLTRIDAPPESRVDRYEAALPAEDVPALLAALEQVTAHPRWPGWESEGRPAEPDTSWTLTPGDTGPAAPADWTATADAGTLRLTGPWVLYYETGRGLLSGEISYADVDGFRAAVTGQ